MLASRLLAFLAARYLLRDVVQSRFGPRLAPINEGVRRGGSYYLLALRLVPAFPVPADQPADGADANGRRGRPARL